METKTSKAQLEVWEWKEKACNLIKDLPKEKQIPFIIESTKETVEWLKERKREKLKVNK